MNWSKRIRQTTRWASRTFTVLIVVNIALNLVAPAREQPALWVGVLTLLPLAVLMLTGLYLFVLPHATRWSTGRCKSEEETIALAVLR